MTPTARKLQVGSPRCTLRSWWLEDMRKGLIILLFQMMGKVVMMGCWLSAASFTACAVTIISQWSELPILESSLLKNWLASASAQGSLSGVQEEEPSRKNLPMISSEKSKRQQERPTSESTFRPLMDAAKTEASWRRARWPKPQSSRAPSRQTQAQRQNSSTTSSCSKIGRRSDHPNPSFSYLLIIS